MNDVVRDEKSGRPNGPHVDENVIRGHRADMWVGTGIHMPAYPTGPKRPRHKQHNRTHKRHKRMPTDAKEDEEDKKRLLGPGQRVQFLLNQDAEDGGGITGSDMESRRIFTEMVELADGQQEWRETARWVKFEEDVEEGGNRWSKPHVATLSLHSLFELRSCLLTGAVVLDLEATELTQVVDILLDKLIASKLIVEDVRELIRESLLRKHTHQYEHAKAQQNKEGGQGAGAGGSTFLNTVRSIADIGRSFSHAKNLQHQTAAAAHDSPIADDDHNKVGKTLSIPQGTNGGSSSAPPSAISPTTAAKLNLPKVGSIPKEISREASMADATKGNQHFFKKIPAGAEASNVMVGQVDFLEHHISAFIRLKQAVFLGDLTEVPVPTRFLFVLLGPVGHGNQFHEIGRAIATLMADEVFHDVAYKAHDRADLLDGVDEFLDQVTVLPPGEWDPNIRIEPPSTIPSQDKRKALPKSEKDDEDLKELEKEVDGGGHGMDPALKRTGRPFGGLIADVKRKLPFFASDFKDALNLQCLAAFLFMYFAMLAPIVTFGGLLEEATDKRMAAVENLLSGAICGSIYSLLSGQPLTMIGSTGPVLVFEKIIFTMTLGSWDYLAFRWWINLWSFLICLLIVATDASALVSYITRFTEENFSVLISFIFVYESIAKTAKILKSAYVVAFNRNLDPHPYCECRPKNFNSSWGLDSLWQVNDTTDYSKVADLAHMERWNGNVSLWLYEDGNTTHVDFDKIPLSYCERVKAVLDDPQGQCYRMYDVFLMSFVLTLGTFALAYTLKMMRNTCYFPNKIREILSDFAVFIALSIMVLVDYSVGLDTPKLYVPKDFQPTWAPHRGWIIDPFNNNPWYSAIVALAPAVLLCILLFMDHQITVVIVNRKENKLKKGCGYHLDLLIMAGGVLISGFLGLPIFVAATVMSISHVQALRVESECRAPGEKPTFVGIREQRVTGFLVFVFIGLSVVMKSVLKNIPMPVLYGVFLYMGICSLRGVQMIDRLLLFIMPMKYQPDFVYLRHVPLNRVQLFTIFQVGCFVILCVMKEIEITSIVFPIMLVVMVGVRKLMEYVFTERELKYLDDPMPEITLRKKEDISKKKEAMLQAQQESEVTQLAKLGTVKTEANLHIQLASGNVMKIPLSSIGEKSPDDSYTNNDSPENSKKPSQTATAAKKSAAVNGPPAPAKMNISEEVNRSGLWQHIASEASLTSKEKAEKRNGKKQSFGKTSTAAAPSSSSKLSASHRGDLMNTAALAAADADDDDDDLEPITIRIERATPDPKNLPPQNDAAEMQPLLTSFSGGGAADGNAAADEDDDKKRRVSQV